MVWLGLHLLVQHLSRLVVLSTLKVYVVASPRHLLDLSWSDFGVNLLTLMTSKRLKPCLQLCVFRLAKGMVVWPVTDIHSRYGGRLQTCRSSGVTLTVRIILPADVRACTVHITKAIVADDNVRWQPCRSTNTTNADHSSPWVFNWMFAAATTYTSNAQLIHSDTAAGEGSTTESAR